MDAERPEVTDLCADLARSTDAMIRFALARGKPVPPTLVAAVSQCRAILEEGVDAPARTEAVRRLAAAHDRLAQIVAPATPEGILLLDGQRAGGFASFLGPVRLVRSMMAAAIVCLLLFVGIGLSPEINMLSERSDLFDLSGRQALLAELFRLSAAGLGAAFAALFQANRYIVEGSFDPRYEPSYWIRFGLGLMAGLILTELVPLDPAPGTEPARIGKPLVALLGGFSAILVYRILQRLVTTVEALVRGDAGDILAARNAAADARLAEQRVRSRFETAARLIPLQQQLLDGSPSEEVRTKLLRILDDLLDGPFEEGAPKRAENK